jgi:hypothetical protein
VQHGVKRVRNPPTVDDAAVQAKKREKETKRIQEYTGLVEELQAKVRHSVSLYERDEGGNRLGRDEGVLC